MAHVIKNLLSPEQIAQLLRYMSINDNRVDQRPDVRSKHPRWDIDPWPQDAIRSILDTVLDYSYSVEEVIFNESIISFRLHADSGDGNVDRLGHAILIPLFVDGPSTTVFFNNYWDGPSTRFSRKPILPLEYNIPLGNGNTFYTDNLRVLLSDIKNGCTPVELLSINNLEAVITDLIEARTGNKISKPDDRTADYSKIINFNPNSIIDPLLKSKYLSHIPEENLYGLNLEKIIEWCPGDVIVFDRRQIHSAGSGHNKKIGITIFTQRC